MNYQQITEQNPILKTAVDLLVAETGLDGEALEMVKDLIARAHLAGWSTRNLEKVA